MDPLSVASSVAGLLIAGAQISSALQAFASGSSGVPSLAQHVQSEVHDFTVVLSKLQPFLLAPSLAGNPQAYMIDVGQLLITLTGCVCTFSELQLELNGLKMHYRMGIRSRLKWTMAGPTVSNLIQRLQNHKLSLTLMLTILTSGSSIEARDSVNEFCTLIEQLVQSNGQLSNWLIALESQLSTFRPGTTKSHSSAASTRSNRSYQHSFEKILLTTRIYQKASLNSSTISFATMKSRRTHLSFLSGFSVDQVSSLSVLSLPICATEVSNPRCYNANTPPSPSPRTAPKGLGPEKMSANSPEDLVATRPVHARRARKAVVIGTYKWASVMTTGDGSYTELHLAVLDGRGDIVKDILRRTTSVDERTDNGCTALHLAARDGWSDIVRALLESGADKDARVPVVEDTPLLLAVEGRQSKTVSVLLEHGVNIHAKDSFGNTALYLAMGMGEYDIAKLLK